MAKKGTPLNTLELHQGTINLLTRAGITTVEQLGQTPVGRLKAVTGLSKAKMPEIFTAYSTWFAQNICPAPPPLPPMIEWQPITRRLTP